MKILALDTATESCSAALLIDGTITYRELELERGHAEQILLMIDGLLTEAALPLSSLDAIAFGRGPGGFTGVRLAASITQGLAFGAGVPVIPVSDLKAVAQRVFALDSAMRRVLVCNDARMREVYWSCFEAGADGLAAPVGEERVGKPETVTLPAHWAYAHGAGRGFRAYPEIAQGLANRLAGVDDTLLPRAQEIVMLAAPVFRSGGAQPPEQAIPVYVRDDVARPSVV